MSTELEIMTMEVRDRVRRVEMRLTKLLTHFGVETGAKVCAWDPVGIVAIPDLSCGIKDILAVIPKDYPMTEAGVNITFKGRFICFVRFENYRATVLRSPV